MIYKFGRFSLDPDRLELRDDEALVTVEPQVFALLAFLIENRDKVVAKDEIIDEVWDGRIVSDGTLNSRINAARRALGDDGKIQAIIKTFPRRGFRFVAKVTDNGDIAETQISALPSADKPSIAVLPFVNLSSDPEQEYFSDGITEDIITALSRIRQLVVHARNSTIAYKERIVDVRKIAKDLRVRYVLEGSVRKAGGRVRISAQLIDGESGNHLWAEKFDRDLDDIFTIQDEITESVVGAVEPEITKSEIIKTRARRPENLSVWENYIQGSFYLIRRSEGDIIKAIQQLERAIEVDPDFAPAYQGLSYAYCMGTITGVIDDPAKSINIAITMAKMALRLDRDDDRSHLAYARALFRKGNDEAAFAAIQEALKLNPVSAFNQYMAGRILIRLDRAEEGLKYAKEALRLSPRDMWISPFLVTIAEAHLTLGNYEAAVKWSDRALREANAIWIPAAVKTVAYFHLGRTKETRQALDVLKDKFPVVTTSFLRTNPWVINSPAYTDFIDALRTAGLPE